MEIVVAEMLIIVCICWSACVLGWSGIAYDIFILWQCCKGWSKAVLIWYDSLWTFGWHLSTWFLFDVMQYDAYVRVDRLRCCITALAKICPLSFRWFRRIWLVRSLPKSCGTTLMISSKANSPQAGAVQKTYANRWELRSDAVSHDMSWYSFAMIAWWFMNALWLLSIASEFSSTNRGRCLIGLRPKTRLTRWFCLHLQPLSWNLL